MHRVPKVIAQVWDTATGARAAIRHQSAGKCSHLRTSNSRQTVTRWHNSNVIMLLIWFNLYLNAMRCIFSSPCVSSLFLSLSLRPHDLSEAKQQRVRLFPRWKFNHESWSKLGNSSWKQDLQEPWGTYQNYQSSAFSAFDKSPDTLPGCSNAVHPKLTAATLVVFNATASCECCTFCFALIQASARSVSQFQTCFFTSCVFKPPMFMLSMFFPLWQTCANWSSALLTALIWHVLILYCSLQWLVQTRISGYVFIQEWFWRMKDDRQGMIKDDTEIARAWNRIVSESWAHSTWRCNCVVTGEVVIWWAPSTNTIYTAIHGYKGPRGRSGRWCTRVPQADESLHCSRCFDATGSDPQFTPPRAVFDAYPAVSAKSQRYVGCMCAIVCKCSHFHTLHFFTTHKSELLESKSISKYLRVLIHFYPHEARAEHDSPWHRASMTQMALQPSKSAIPFWIT